MSRANSSYCRFLPGLTSTRLCPWACSQTGFFNGFLYTSGDFTQIVARGSAVDINDAGQIVGVIIPGIEHGFLYTGGNFTLIDVPGAPRTAALGINDAGQIVGWFQDSGEEVTHGFLYTGGSFTQIDVPGATSTIAVRINDMGQIVGSFDNSTGVHGFLNAGGTFTQIDVPGATSTVAGDINDAGQIVGGFEDSGGFGHGFLATPIIEPVPEPSTLALLSVGIGLTVLCVMRRRGEPIIPKQ